MRRMQVWMTLGCGLFAVSAIAMGITDKKPGLYEVTSNMTWVQSPFPSGMVPPAAPTTLKVCLTQEMIDKYGGGAPQTRGSCTVSNLVVRPGKVSADMVCTGQMSGKGSFESTWSDPNLSTDSAHFTGEMKMGPNTKPVEWKTSGTSKFISSDCGSVKPLGTPLQHSN